MVSGFKIERQNMYRILTVGERVCLHTYMIYKINTAVKVKGKEIPLQAWSGPEGSRKLRFLD